MKPNPGGILVGEAIINRDNEINSIWRALENQSVVFMSERRVGKTSVLRKMEENPHDNWKPLLYWVEGKRHPIEFVEGLYELLITKGMLEDKFYNLKKYYKKYINGETIGNWRFPQISENWKTLLISIIEDIINADDKVLLMLDELPLMLSQFIKIKECGSQIAMEFLDTLRGIRNQYEPTKQITFIFCGSVGIHLIIKELKRNHGYTGDPINNMKLVTLSGMAEPGAILLCQKLSENSGYKFKDQQDIFNYICNKTDKLPFYIQHVFAYLEESGQKTIDRLFIDKAIDYLLNDPKDEGFFRHYIDRIKTYYDDELKDCALLILDQICKWDDFGPEDEIINLVRKTGEISNESIRETLDLLWNDHYLEREIKNNIRNYKFRYQILKMWWRVNRG